MNKQIIKDNNFLNHIYDWFNNQYDHCENVKQDAKQICVSVLVNKTVIINDLTRIMELWLKNDNNFRLDYERDIGNQTKDSIKIFVNNRSKFFKI